VISALPAAPVAMRMKESLVEVSPSTVMLLKDRSAASLARPSSSACETAASQARKPSMVAMLGLIMPAPLLMPVRVTVLPPICTCLDTALARVSVVMIACAASNQPSARRSAIAAGRPATRRSTGSGSRITPVENGSTCSAASPICCASAAQVACALARPGSPVPALATPVLITSARIAPPAYGLAHLHRRGAEAVLVNTPATRLPGGQFDHGEVARLALRMPASATPRRTPCTGSRSAGSG
jgi:hypothetical protein